MCCATRKSHESTKIIIDTLIAIEIKGAAGAENVRRQFSMDQDDELLQYAIHQSLVDSGGEKDEVDIWEALKTPQYGRSHTPQPAGAGSHSPLPLRPTSALGII